MQHSRLNCLHSVEETVIAFALCCDRFAAAEWVVHVRRPSREVHESACELQETCKAKQTRIAVVIAHKPVESL